MGQKGASPEDERRKYTVMCGARTQEEFGVAMYELQTAHLPDRKKFSPTEWEMLWIKVHLTADQAKTLEKAGFKINLSKF